MIQDEIEEIRVELERICTYLELPSPRLTKMKRRTPSPNRIHSALHETVEELNSPGSCITFVRRLEENDVEFCIRGVGQDIPGNLRNRERSSGETMPERILRTLRLLCMCRRRQRS
ncbi:hypothetical protein Trydic_g14969 [Trypoxylus dichotomus]